MRVLGSPALHARSRSTSTSCGRAARRAQGSRQPRPVDLGDGIEVRAWFTPEYGDALSHRVAKFLGRARRRIRIASPVLNSGPILGTLVEIVNEHRCDVAGVIDETQVDEVFHQWATNGVSAWKIPLLDKILVQAPFSGKPTTPWTPQSTHDFMHAKVIVADDVSFVGSFNFSRSGEQNAENVLEIHDPTSPTASPSSSTRCAPAIRARRRPPSRVECTREAAETSAVKLVLSRRSPPRSPPRPPEAQPCRRRRAARSSLPTTRGTGASTRSPSPPGRTPRSPRSARRRPCIPTSALASGTAARSGFRSPSSGRRR